MAAFAEGNFAESNYAEPSNFGPVAATVTATPATATATALAPVVTGNSSGTAIVLAVPATATATALAPAVGVAATVVVPRATATALALPPTFTQVIPAGTDTSNFLYGRNRRASASVTVVRPAAAVPSRAAVRHDKSVPLPPPTLVDGRPT